MFGFFSQKQSGKKAQLPPLRFHNTLSNRLEPFTPLSPGSVKMYNCGPTVYSTQHIGNMRAATLADLLRRVFTQWNYEVSQVINITDFGHLTSDADEGDDKMSLGLKNAGLEPTLANMRVLAEKYAREYFDDITSLGVPLDRIQFPRASDFIPEQISLITSLEEKEYAYRTPQGVYYDVSRFPSYGRLGNINLAGQKEGARVQENSQKRGPFDFILWKSDPKLGWESPWGIGFPGWHIECTAMIFKLLGKQIDVHTGGIEHIPVHHNNEIAQAEAATGRKFATFWLHNDHITIEGKKISKSLGNTVYLHSLVDRGIDPYALRYWFMTAHYRSPANFTWDAIEASQTALGRLSRLYVETKIESQKSTEVVKTKDTFTPAFLSAIGDDLDTPKALAHLWDYTKTDVSARQKFNALQIADRVLGLGFEDTGKVAKVQVIAEVDIPKEIQSLLKEREEARATKDFKKADELRDKIIQLGFKMKDTPTGPNLSPFP